MHSWTLSHLQQFCGRRFLKTVWQKWENLCKWKYNDWIELKTRWQFLLLSQCFRLLQKRQRSHVWGKGLSRFEQFILRKLRQMPFYVARKTRWNLMLQTVAKRKEHVGRGQWHMRINWCRPSHIKLKCRKGMPHINVQSIVS